jgi:hypothetical protein
MGEGAAGVHAGLDAAALGFAAHTEWWFKINAQQGITP